MTNKNNSYSPAKLCPKKDKPINTNNALNFLLGQRRREDGRQDIENHVFVLIFNKTASEKKSFDSLEESCKITVILYRNVL